MFHSLGPVLLIDPNLNLKDKESLASKLSELKSKDRDISSDNSPSFPGQCDAIVNLIGENSWLVFEKLGYQAHLCGRILMNGTLI